MRERAVINEKLMPCHHGWREVAGHGDGPFDDFCPQEKLQPRQTYVNCSLAGADLAGMAQPGAKFFNCEAQGLNISSYDSPRTHVAADYSGITVQGGDWTACRFTDVAFDGSDFQTDLSGSAFRGGSLRNVDLRDSKTENVLLDAAPGGRPVDLQGCKMNVEQAAGIVFRNVKNLDGLELYDRSGFRITNWGVDPGTGRLCAVRQAPPSIVTTIFSGIASSLSLAGKPATRDMQFVAGTLSERTPAFHAPGARSRWEAGP